MTSHNQIPIRMALIGCGNIGIVHAERLAADPRVDITLLYDVQRNNAERIQREYSPQAQIVENWKNCLKTARVDACLISSPTVFHYEQTFYCLQQKIPVLCEKPLTKSRTEILNLVELAAQNETPISIAYQRRSNSVYKTLRREVLSGRWGKVQSISGCIVEDWQSTIGGTWRDNPELNQGGFIGDAGSHKIDCLFFATGLTPLEVMAQSDRCGSNVEITAQVLGKFSEQVTVGINFIGNGSHMKEDIHIHCERGDLMVRDEKLWLANNNQVTEITDLELDSTPVQDFISMLIDGTPNVAPPECALPVYDFTQAILKSATSHQPVSITN